MSLYSDHSPCGLTLGLLTVTIWVQFHNLWYIMQQRARHLQVLHFLPDKCLSMNRIDLIGHHTVTASTLNDRLQLLLQHPLFHCSSNIYIQLSWFILQITCYFQYITEDIYYYVIYKKTNKLNDKGWENQINTHCIVLANGLYGINGAIKT